jgi:uncharacterized membrane protein YccC
VLELIWIVTAWPDGALAITFGAVWVILFSPRAEQAHAGALALITGISLTVAIAAIVDFAVLPDITTFVGFTFVLAIVFVPAAALLALSWQPMLITPVAVLFVAVSAPANQMVYDTQRFYNASLGIVVGVIATALAFRLLPPLSPALRTRRLLTLTLRDLRRLTTGRTPRTGDWARRVIGRLSQLPDEAQPVQRAELMAALSIGAAIIRLRRVMPRFDRSGATEAALKAVARGDGAAATEHFSGLDRTLAALENKSAGARIRLRARGSILAILEALEQHATFFDSGKSV